MLRTSLSRHLVVLGTRQAPLRSALLAPISRASVRPFSVCSPVFAAHDIASHVNPAAEKTSGSFQAEKVEVIHGSIPRLTLPLSSGEKYYPPSSLVFCDTYILRHSRQRVSVSKCDTFNLLPTLLSRFWLWLTPHCQVRVSPTFERNCAWLGPWYSRRRKERQGNSLSWRELEKVNPHPLMDFLSSLWDANIAINVNSALFVGLHTQRELRTSSRRPL